MEKKVGEKSWIERLDRKVGEKGWIERLERKIVEKGWRERWIERFSLFTCKCVI